MSQDRIFQSADIFLPDFQKVDPRKWAVIACDQFTSEPEYWEDVEKTVGDAPSTLRLILPEVYLDKAASRIPQIQATMKAYLDENIIQPREDSMIYVERTQTDGTVRKGLVCAIDLEQYDFSKGSLSLIRATEGTVLERIPPRVRIREGAVLELPHVMLLIDDPENGFIDLVASHCESRAYDFDLMAGGGHIKGSFLSKSVYPQLLAYAEHLISPAEIGKKYGPGLAPLLFAVGDGNHSLATAKTAYEAVKARFGDSARSHPARYALCEIVNLHDPALSFEPIYRVVFGADPKELSAAFKAYCGSLSGPAGQQTIQLLTEEKTEDVKVLHPIHQLSVGTVQTFLDQYLASHPGCSVDYVHDLASVQSLIRGGTVGFIFEGMRKDELFRSVMMDGSLPRKTFSMGHARDKRYYLEARAIEEIEDDGC